MPPAKSRWLTSTERFRAGTREFRLGIFDRPLVQTPIDAAGDGAIARSIGEQSAVLLKNASNLLPLNAAALRSVAVIGQAPYADKAVSGCCGGSSDVIPLYTVLPLQGVQNVLQKLGSSASASLTLVNTDNSNLDAAVAAAKAADAVIVMAGAITEEGADRPNLSLPNNQDAMISAILAANPRTVIVLKDGGPVLMPWVDQASTILEAWFPARRTATSWPICCSVSRLPRASYLSPIQKPRATCLLTLPSSGRVWT